MESACVRACACVRALMCVCMCVCVRARARACVCVNWHHFSCFLFLSSIPLCSGNVCKIGPQTQILVLSEKIRHFTYCLQVLVTTCLAWKLPEVQTLPDFTHWLTRIYISTLHFRQTSPQGHLHVVGMLRFVSFDINQPSLSTPFCSALGIHIWFYGPFSCISFHKFSWNFPQWGTADAEFKDLSVENQVLKGSPFKALSRSVCSHACYAYLQGFLPC